MAKSVEKNINKQNFAGIMESRPDPRWNRYPQIASGYDTGVE